MNARFRVRQTGVSLTGGGRDPCSVVLIFGWRSPAWRTDNNPSGEGESYLEAASSADWCQTAAAPSIVGGCRIGKSSKCCGYLLAYKPPWLSLGFAALRFCFSERHKPRCVCGYFCRSPRERRRCAEHMGNGEHRGDKDAANERCASHANESVVDLLQLAPTDGGW